MTVDIPTGWAQVTITWTGPTKTGRAATVLGYDARAVPNLTSVADAVREAYQEGLAPLQDTSWGMETIRVMDNDHVHEIAGVYGGQRSGVCVPPNIAVLVKLTTAQRGRKYRGRNYWPGFLHDGDTDELGNIDIDRWADLRDGFQTWGEKLAANDVFPVILHNDPDEPPTEVTSGGVDRMIVTQRRRMR